MNKKACRSALRSALSVARESGHARASSTPAAFDEPSTKTAAELLEEWGKERPLV